MDNFYTCSMYWHIYWKQNASSLRVNLIFSNAFICLSYQFHSEVYGKNPITTNVDMITFLVIFYFIWRVDC